MTNTTNLGLPCIEAAQAQKHVTHNDALRMLDALVQLAVLDRDLSAPPPSPLDGQRWIVKPTGTGAWAGHDNAIAAWQDGAWTFYPPQAGWLVYVQDEGAVLGWNGSAWSDAIAAPTVLNNLALLGVGATADASNPLSVTLNNALFAAKTVAEGGDGTLRYKLSKENTSGTLSFLFQDNFSGRAEFGLCGDDNFHFKVSPDGSTWVESFIIDSATGLFSKSPNRSQVEVFSADDTYAVPPWASRLRIVATGGGGGGGAGGAGDNTAARTGGGGGAAGGIAIEEYRTADIGPSLTVTVGAGGAGGTGVGGNATGNPGSRGSDSIVADGATTLIFASGGNPGAGGGTANAAGGGLTPSMFIGQDGGMGTSTLPGGGAGTSIVAIAAGAGGGGGGIVTSGVTRPGGAGGVGYSIGGSSKQASGGAGGITSSPDGGGGADKQTTYGRGGGGGGGVSNASGNGGAGGKGGSVGGGGGGGGASRDTGVSGAGGNGGDGEIWIFAYS